MKIFVIVTYLLLLIGVLAIILIRIKNNKKVHPAWYYALAVLVLLPILYILTIGSFSVTQTEGLQEFYED